ncbi:MAG TPA: hypothetical protein VE135_00780 [Pyrinomonadaceae bacterium]|nr:hypothetical protein [Pyrinomonadaceae bacterium]
MKSHSPFALTVALILSFYSANAQTSTGLETRPRTVSQTQQPQQQVPASTNKAEIQPLGNPSDVRVNTSGASVTTLAPVPVEERAPQLPTSFSPSTIRSRIAEAERLMKTRPQPTALTSPSIEFVTIAALDRATSRIHLFTVSKETFLKKNADLSLISSQGMPVDLRILRANGVNTAVTLTDAGGRALAPLVVEFPIEKGGVFREMAYYTSAHPALLSNDLTRSGQAYVRSMLDLAVKRLREKGAFISPQIVDVAERLCLVEHVDHERFRAENRLALYNEVYSLYALNELDTYRYSVSFAGAGGMVQMIPWAYNLIRQRHSGVGLTPDFVAGMRNHSNALQAMLLYMQDTWNDLTASADVKAALDSKTATPAELMAAGYNSNAAKLPLYLRRGGDSWRTLIPRETQMYLQIYKSFESLVPLKLKAADSAEAIR